MPTNLSQKQIWCYLGVVWVLWMSATGCRSITQRANWHPPEVIAPKSMHLLSGEKSPPWEKAYAEAVSRDKADQSSCVDYYYRAAVLAWPCVDYDLRNKTQLNVRAREVYHSSLIKMVERGQCFDRFDPQKGLVIQMQDGPHTVPVLVKGFPWRPLEIDRLVAVGSYETDDVTRQYRAKGLGVPLVAVHKQRPGIPFQRQQQTYSATLLLRPGDQPQDTFTLELVDSLRFGTTEIQGREVPIQRDLTAPIAYVLKDVDDHYIRSFVQPGSNSVNTGLFMIEPYQPGKIPLVFVHGLLSDRYTWANMANELRARPDLVAKYQVLGFEYSTGEPFLSGAAILRRHLTELRLNYDPEGCEPAMSEIVLVGHSMGGLVAKLQISACENQLWDTVSSLPFNQVVMSPKTRKNLGEAFFFEPVPSISRVIYMGTPHRGSPWARRPVGRLGSCLVEDSDETTRAHEQVIKANPGVFSKEFSRRIPTSIDLLRPESPLLLAMDKLPTNPCVPQHSIIGSWVPMVGAGMSDSVVPINSAIRKGAQSELIIHAKHTKLHHSDAGVCEIVRILRLHTQQCQEEQAPTTRSPSGEFELLPESGSGLN